MKGVVAMGAIRINEYTFEPEFSVVNQKGTIHVYYRGKFIEDIVFQFEGQYPEHDLIEELVNHYCFEHNIKD